MNNFLNDYKDFGCKEIYENMQKIFDNNYCGYGLDEISNNATSLNSDILNDDANEQKASSQNNLASQNIQIEMLNKSKQNEEEVKTIRKKGFKICEPNEQNQNLQASDESSSKRNLKTRQSKQNAQLNGAAFSISDAN